MVTKGQDITDPEVEADLKKQVEDLMKLPEEERVLALIKMQHRTGGVTVQR